MRRLVGLVPVRLSETLLRMGLKQVFLGWTEAAVTLHLSGWTAASITPNRFAWVGQRLLLLCTSQVGQRLLLLRTGFLGLDRSCCYSATFSGWTVASVTLTGSQVGQRLLNRFFRLDRGFCYSDRFSGWTDASVTLNRCS